MAPTPFAEKDDGRPTRQSAWSLAKPKPQMPILLIILNAFILAIAFVIVQAIVRAFGFGDLLLLGLSLPILALLVWSLPRLAILARATL
jgi:hypothetical protein